MYLKLCLLNWLNTMIVTFYSSRLLTRWGKCRSGRSRLNRHEVTLIMLLFIIKIIITSNHYITFTLSSKINSLNIIMKRWKRIHYWILSFLFLYFAIKCVFCKWDAGSICPKNKALFEIVNVRNSFIKVTRHGPEI